MKYRLHSTCQAGHTTYDDYKSMRTAKKNFDKMEEENNKTGWYPTMIEVIISDKWIKTNGMWENIIIKQNKPRPIIIVQ